jgi:hypothetical protein
MTKRILLVLITVFLLAACSALPKSNGSAANTQTTSNQPQSNQNKPTTPANTQAAPSLSADEVYLAVKAAWAKSDTAGPRHISQNSSKGGTVESNIEADVVPPDFHQVVSAMGNVVAEQYIVGGTIYNKVGGAWSQTAGGGTALSMIGSFTQSFSDSLVYTNGMVNGIEDVNGSPAIVYSYSTTLKGLDASAQYKLWVDQSTGLPVRSVNITPDGLTIDQTITYDNNIAITLIDEAKNAPPAQ